MGNSNTIESSHKYNPNMSVSIIDSANYVNAEIYNDFENTDTDLKCLHYNVDFTKMYKFRSETIKDKDLPGVFPEINYNEDEDAEEPTTEPVTDINSFYPDAQMQFVLEL